MRFSRSDSARLEQAAEAGAKLVFAYERHRVKPYTGQVDIIASEPFAKLITNPNLPWRKEILLPRAVVRRLRRIEACHPLGERRGDGRDVARIEMQVRIARGMHVAQRAIDAAWLLDQRDGACRLEVSRLSGLDLGIARLRLQQRRPTDLELRSGAHHQVGIARPRDQAGPRLDAVRILQRGRGDVDARLVAAQLLRQRAPLGLAGKDVQCCMRLDRRQHYCRGKKKSHGGP